MALSPKDKVEVATALKTISTKWYSIGLQLGVPVYRLERIDASRWKSADCLMEVVEKWLAQKDGKQTWRALVEALRAQSVGEGKLAMRLERKHCSTDPLAGKVHD